ncbi:MAG: hypothetical protein DWQ02_14320 [Bacteroidetes bacterium]|nr:MAG: hypothetical protein DWQ02_14320 [Bacteroidota bacterium]
MKQFFIPLLLIMPGLVFAQGLFESSVEEVQEQSELNLDFNGYTRGTAWLGSEQYDYGLAFGELAFQGKLEKNRTWLFTDLRFRSGYRFETSFTEMEIKEAYAGFTGEKVDVRLGNQIVSWGRTDGFNPTNNITPEDYFFLTPDPDDQKLSNFMLRFKYRFNAVMELDVIGIPLYRPSVYRFDLFDMGEDVSFGDFVTPERSFKNGSFAVRFNVELPKSGFSFSWFRGYASMYGFDVREIDWSSGSPVITNAGMPYRKNSLGADLSVPIGSWIARTELAFNLVEEDEERIYIPNSDLSYVIGLEHNFGGFNTLLQYIGKYTFNFSDPKTPVLLDPADPVAQLVYANEMICHESLLFNRRIFYQQEETNHAFALSISRSFRYETLQASLSAYYNFTSEEYLLRPELEWKITDGLSAKIGFSLMDGPENSLFSYSGPVMSGGFIQLKAGF